MHPYTIIPHIHIRNIIEVSSLDEIRDEYEHLLKRYDFYYIQDLSELRNKNNRCIFHCDKEQGYLVITPKEVKREIVKKMRKPHDFREGSTLCPTNGTAG